MNNKIEIVDVIIVSWHPGDCIIDTINSVINDEFVNNIIVVNHGMQASTKEKMIEKFSNNNKFCIIETNKNLGFSRGCNIGAERASGPILFFLNPDANARDGCVSSLANGLLSNPIRPVIYGARIINTDGTEQRGGRRGELTLFSAFSGFLGLSRLLPMIRDIHREYEPLPGVPVVTQSVSGAALMIRRDDYFSVGGYDEGFFLHVEDIDLCRRVRNAGGLVVFHPDAEVVHIGSTSDVSRIFVAHQKAIGLRRYFLKHSGVLKRQLVRVIFPIIWILLMIRVIKLYHK
jgi:N-acetylglucosaminyl-diphospho-decaprenol L-rhamnosyltransferase